jgi:PurA ssDNA and RNA-binding protein
VIEAIGEADASMRNFDFDDGGGRPPPVPPLHSEKLVSDRKIFFLDLKENDRGRFIKITEDVRGRRDTIMLPIEVAQEFMDAIQKCLEADHELR